jgi:hypothetical protein
MACKGRALYLDFLRLDPKVLVNAVTGQVPSNGKNAIGLQWILLVDETAPNRLTCENRKPREISAVHDAYEFKRHKCGTSSKTVFALFVAADCSESIFGSSASSVRTASKH